MILYHAIFGKNDFFQEVRNIESEVESITRKCGWKGKLGTDGEKRHIHW